MMPSLDDQERIFVNKFVYRLEPIERGDIVVFRYPYGSLEELHQARDRHGRTITSASMPGRSM